MQQRRSRQPSGTAQHHHHQRPPPRFSCDEEAEFRRALDAIPPPPPPDGGWGWMVVLGSFFCNAIVDGVCFSFGVFLKEFMDYFDTGAALAGLVGSLLLGCYLLSGPITSALANRYGCRRITIAGSLIAMFAFLISTCSNNVGVLMSLYGILAGLGFGMIYLPAVVVVGLYFERRRSLAMGLAMCGSGVGTFAFAPIASRLLDEYNWRGAAVIVAGLALNGVACGALFRPLDDDLRRRRKVILHKLEEDKRIGPNTCIIMQRLLDEKRRQRTLSTGSLNNVVITRDNRLLRGDELAAAIAAAKASAAQTASAAASAPGGGRPRGLLDRVRGVLARSNLSLGGSRGLVSGSGSPSAIGTPPTVQRQRNSLSRSSAGAGTPPATTPVPMIVVSRPPDGGGGDQLPPAHVVHLVPAAQASPAATASAGDAVAFGRSPPKDGGSLALGKLPWATAANGGGGSCAGDESELLLMLDARDSGAFGAAAEAAPDGSGGDVSGMVTPDSAASSSVASSATATLQLPSPAGSGFSGSAAAGGAADGDSLVSAQSLMRQVLGQIDSPLYRRDVLYASSVTNLQQYRSAPSVDAYMRSVASLQPGGRAGADGAGDEPLSHLSSEPWIWRALPCVPKPVRDVLSTMLDFRSLASPTFFLLSFSSLLTMIGFFVPFAYLMEASLDVGVDAKQAPYLISLLGLANMVGRVTASVLTNRAWVDCLIVNNVALIVAGGVTLLVPLCVSFVTLAIYAIAYGLCIAAFIALRSVIVVELMGVDKLTSAFGQLILFQGLAITAGTPLAGLLRDLTGSYDASFYMAGAAIALSGLLCFPLRRLSERERRLRFGSGAGGHMVPSDASSEEPLRKAAVSFDEDDPPSRLASERAP